MSASTQLRELLEPSLRAAKQERADELAALALKVLRLAAPALALWELGGALQEVRTKKLWAVDEHLPKKGRSFEVWAGMRLGLPPVLLSALLGLRSRGSEAPQDLRAALATLLEGPPQACASLAAPKPKAKSAAARKDIPKARKPGRRK